MIDVGTALATWIPKVQGQYLNEDWNTENQGFGAQCWDAAANWAKTLGLPVINTGGDKGRWPGWAGNMVDAFPQSPEIAAAYELIASDQPGRPGDVAVWGDSYWYYPKTHVAVLIRDLDAQLLCMSQNSTAAQLDNPYPQWTTGPTTIQHLPRQGLIGFIRPRTAGIASQSGAVLPMEEGIFMALSEAEQRRILAAADRINGVIDQPKDKVLTTAHIDQVAASAAAKVLNTPIRRGGAGAALGEVTSVGAVVGWFDSAIIGLAGAINAQAKASGATPEQVIAAVKEALATGVVQVDVNVNGGK